MNLILWILQGGLALLFRAGGAYELYASKELANDVGVLPSGAWRAIGALEVLGAIFLIVPAATGWMPGLTTLAAAILAVGRYAIGPLNR